MKTPNLLSDPHFKAYVGEVTALQKLVHDLPLPQQRQKQTEFVLKKTHCTETLQSIQDFIIPGAHPIPIRVYTPFNTPKSNPLLIYFHGGGWVFGNIEESDAVCRRLANATGYTTLSVEYRLAPEHPFPTPLDDCYNATLWIAAHAKQFGGNANNILISGESAGGNLAAAVALKARDLKTPVIKGQILIYPVTSTTIHRTDFTNCPDQSLMTESLVRYFLKKYLPHPDDRHNPYAALDLAENLTGLPPTILISAEFDPFRHQEERFAAKLIASGVMVIAKCFPSVIHGFIYTPLYEERQKALWTKEIGHLIQGAFQ